MAPAASTQRATQVLAFAALYVLWGSTYLGIRIGLQAALPPALSAGLRFVPAGVILLAMARLRGARIRLSRRDFVTVCITGLLLLGGGTFSVYLAEQYIPSGISALITALIPIWIAAGESVLPGMERPSLTGIAGLVLGFSGLVVLLYPRLTGVHAGQGELAGVAIQLAGGWAWSAGSIVAKRRPVRADALVVTGYQMLIAGAVLFTVGVARGQGSHLAQIGWAGAAAIDYLVVFGSCVAFTAFVWLLRNVPASKVMTYAYVNPVVAVFLGWAAGQVGLLDRPEPIDGWIFAGMAVIVIGVAITTRAPVRRTPGESVAVRT